MDRPLVSRAPVAPRGRRGSTFADLFSWLRGAWRRWLLLRERDAIRRSLGSLSDATLRDLGLTRGEFGSVAVEVLGQAEATRRRTTPAGHWTRP